MLAVCYCGATQKIVDCVDDLMARSDFLEGYILNDLANEVLFNASNAMNRRLYNEFKAQGYHLSTRLTPGENHFEHGVSGAVPLPAHAGRAVPRHAH